MNQFKSIFTLNKVIDKKIATALVATQIAALVLFWIFSPSVFLPSPSETFVALSKFWKAGLYQHLETSLKLNAEAILYSTLVSLVLAYLTVIPFFRPMVAFVSKLRFLSLIGLSFIFSLSISSGHNLKLAILVFSISVYFVTSMADVLNSIPKVQFDLARTLRMKEYQVVWEVIILGQFDKVFDVIRQNAAIGILMLTVVEGIVKSEGGIGTLLVNSNKHLHLNEMLALQLIVLTIGLGQDYIFGIIKNMCCPYATITTERK